MKFRICMQYEEHLWVNDTKTTPTHKFGESTLDIEIVGVHFGFKMAARILKCSAVDEI